MEFLKTFFSKAKVEPSLVPIEDSTLYKVETRTNSYNGHISHQNDIVLWLRSSSDKSVKILKENITRITIL